MFAEACPGNPSRVKQQARVREVSSSLQRCCHRCHVQRCDRLISGRPRSALTTIPALRNLSLRKNVAATWPKRRRGMSSRSVRVWFGEAEALAGLLMGRWCAYDVLGSGERVSLLSFALAAPPLRSA